MIILRSKSRALTEHEHRQHHELGEYETTGSLYLSLSTISFSIFTIIYSSYHPIIVIAHIFYQWDTHSVSCDSEIDRARNQWKVLTPGFSKEQVKKNVGKIFIWSCKRLHVYY